MTQFLKSPSFDIQDNFSPIEQVTARLVAFGPNNEIIVSGSCVRLTKNLYLTAKHVMTDFLNRFGYQGNAANCEVWAIHIKPGPAYSIYTMDRFWFSSLSDLALFHTMPYNDMAHAETVTPTIIIDIAPPPLGSRIVGSGHCGSSGSIRFDEHGTRHIEVNTKNVATVGEVRKIFPRQRDSVMLNFPCFRVNARFDGGMSGGPIFTDNGRVCGIICSSMPAETPDAEHSSYAATLWPLMGMPIDVSPNPYRILDTPYPLINLAHQRILYVENLSQVSVQPGGIVGQFAVTFHGFL